MGSKIEIKRPFNGRDWFDVWHWIEAADQWERLADDNVPRELRAFCQMQEELDSVGARTSWGVWRDDILGGIVSLEPDPLRPWIAHCHCLFRKEFWGRRTTIPALRAVAQEVFDAGIERIEMRVFADNRAIRALIPYIGGIEEGLMRAQARRHGQDVDMAIFGMTRKDFEAAQKAAV